MCTDFRDRPDYGAFDRPRSSHRRFQRSSSDDDSVDSVEECMPPRASSRQPEDRKRRRSRSRSSSREVTVYRTGSRESTAANSSSSGRTVNYGAGRVVSSNSSSFVTSRSGGGERFRDSYEDTDRRSRPAATAPDRDRDRSGSHNPYSGTAAVPSRPRVDDKYVSSSNKGGDNSAKYSSSRSLNGRTVIALSPHGQSDEDVNSDEAARSKKKRKKPSAHG